MEKIWTSSKARLYCGFVSLVCRARVAKLVDALA